MIALRFFWDFISYRKGLMFLLLALSTVVAAAELSIPWIIMKAIDSVLEEGDSALLNEWALKAMVVLAFFYVLHAVLIRIEAQLVLQCSYNLRRRLFTHILTQGMQFFQRYRTGELIHRVFTDAEIFEEDASDLFGDVPFDFLTAVGVIILMMFLDWRLAVMVIAFLILNVFVAGYLGRPLLNIEKTLQQIGARLASRFQEGIAGIRTVKSFKNEDYELSKLDVENRAILTTELKEGRIESVMEPLADLMVLLGLVLVVWYGGHLIIAGALTVGGLVAFIAYMEILSDPLGDIEGYYRDYISCRAMAERLQSLLDDKEALENIGDYIPPEEQWPIEFKGVAFRHHEAERDILRGISFTVQHGEVVVIAGRNGAGKSTLLDLLLRFYDPKSGSITVADVDLRKWDLEFWRRSIGVMSQDVFLFHGTIQDNISYGRADATPEEIQSAAHAAGVDKMVRKFPKGLETIVGERGATLSGGERQRIALARLFLRRPRILLLDEPTAHLDGEALQITLDLLKKLMAGCTTFIVTHQPETIEVANRVLFLEQGRLDGDGTHEALLADNDSYESLWFEKRRGRSIRRRRIPKRNQKRRRQKVETKIET